MPVRANGCKTCKRRPAILNCYRGCGLLLGVPGSPHNPEVVGSNPAPAIHTEANPLRDRRGLFRFAGCRGVRADSGGASSRVVDGRRATWRRKTQEVSLGSLCQGETECPESSHPRAEDACETELTFDVGSPPRHPEADRRPAGEPHSLAVAVACSSLSKFIETGFRRKRTI